MPLSCFFFFFLVPKDESRCVNTPMEGESESITLGSKIKAIVGGEGGESLKNKPKLLEL